MSNDHETGLGDLTLERVALGFGEIWQRFAGSWSIDDLLRWQNGDIDSEVEAADSFDGLHADTLSDLEAFVLMRQFERLAAPLHPDRGAHPHIPTDGVLAHTDSGFVLWNRGRWSGGAHTELARGRPTTPWPFFPVLRYVTNAALEQVDLIAHATKPGEIDWRESAVLGASSHFHDITDFDVNPTADSYLVAPRSGANAVVQQTLTNLLPSIDQLALTLLIGPEGTLDDDVLASCKATLGSRATPTYQSFGTGPLTSDSNGNTAVFVTGKTEIFRQNKRAPFDMTWDNIRRFGLADVLADAGPDGAVEALRLPGGRIRLLEAPEFRLAILICEDLSRVSSGLAALEPFGPTHVIVPVLDTELNEGRWSAHRGALLKSETDANVVVINSTAVARNPSREGAKQSDDWVGSALFIDRNDADTPRVTRSRASTKAALVPQYAPFGTGLTLAELEAGDVLLYPPAADMKSSYPFLHLLIANLDNTFLTHANLVVEADGAAVKVVDRHTEGMKLRSHFLDKVAHNMEAPTHPRSIILAMRPPADKRLVRRVVDCAVSATESEGGYPLDHAAVSAIYLRATWIARRHPDVLDEASLRRLAVALAPSMPGEDQMCAASVATYFECGGLPLQEGNENRHLGLGQDLGASWLRKQDAPSADSPLTLTQRAALAKKTEGGIVAFVAARLQAGDASIDPNLFGADDHAFVEKIGGSEWPDEINFWKGLIEGLKTPVPFPSRKPIPLWTVSDLLRSPSLEPLGHVARWWT